MSKLSQKDYLKKYLLSDDKLKKRKKKADKEKKVKTIAPTVKIIDDDEYHYGHNDIDESELFTMNEEAPQIVGIIDERAPDVIMKQEYIESGKWKKIGETSKSNKQKKNLIRSLSKEDRSPQSKQRDPKDSSEASPSRIHEDKSKGRGRKDSDESPPKSKNRKDSDASPPRRQRRNSDESPPRRQRKDSDASPPRARKRKDSDASPPRRRPRQGAESSPPPYQRSALSASPPLYQRNESSLTPPRRPRESPGRSRKDASVRRGASPSTSRRQSKSPSRRKRSRWSPEIKREPRSQDLSPPRSSRMTKTLDGKVSGLQDAKTLKRENDAYKERQDKLFREMRPEMLGRDAEVVIRDRRGRNKGFEQEAEEEQRKSAVEEARKKEYDRWGKGLKQINDLEKRYQEHMHEASKPLARAADDDDLQDHLKQQERLDDPMLEYMRKKKYEENKKKGMVEMPKYVGQFPDNRYNIPPGYRWDGVDRSNGYEKKFFNMINSKKSMEEEAYRYSTEDM